jgi:hypothetical protein
MNVLLPSSPADVWANLRRLYPIYNVLAREAALESAPCADLEDAVPIPTAEAVAEAEKWFASMDSKIQIQHLRQFLQTSSLTNDGMLRDLLVHYAHAKQSIAQGRDKMDFLLVQMLSELAPANITEEELTLERAASILEPVLGPVQIQTDNEQLGALLREGREHKNLNTLFTARVIERGRQVKEACADKFFEPLTMVACARFGFLMRRMFFRLMHQDLNLIVDGLRQLEARGVTTLDCRKAQFSAEEPVSRLRMICQSWKVMFQAEYSAGQPLCILVDLRSAVEAALKKSPGTEKAKSAAASGDGISD